MILFQIRERSLAPLLIAIVLVLAGSCTPRPPVPPPDRPSGGRVSGAGDRTTFLPAGPLRVALRIDQPEIRVAVDDGALLRWAGGEERVRTTGTLLFRAAGDGAVELGGADGKRFAGPVTLLPERGKPFRIDDRPYDGTLTIIPGEGALAAVNGIGLEEYLRGVVPWEIGWLPESKIEALKAQAVAARTYALTRIGEGDGPWDLVATESDQVYRGVERTDPVVDRAIDETAGLVATYKGELVRTYYSSTCGGRTAPLEEVWFDRESAPYLRGGWDGPGKSSSPSRAFCRASALFRWEENWSGAEELDRIARALAAEQGVDFSRVGRIRDVRVGETGRSGRVAWTIFETEHAEIRIGGDRVRWVLKRPGGKGILRSTWFSLNVKRSKGFVTEITAEGAGYGHGIGMCQWGAMGMAEEGYDFKEILKHYYPGIRLKKTERRGRESGG